MTSTRPRTSAANTAKTLRKQPVPMYSRMAITTNRLSLFLIFGGMSSRTVAHTATNTTMTAHSSADR